MARTFIEQTGSIDVGCPARPGHEHTVGRTWRWQAPISSWMPAPSAAPCEARLPDAQPLETRPVSTISVRTAARIAAESIVVVTFASLLLKAKGGRLSQHRLGHGRAAEAPSVEPGAGCV